MRRKVGIFVVIFPWSLFVGINIIFANEELEQTELSIGKITYSRKICAWIERQKEKEVDGDVKCY